MENKLESEDEQVERLIDSLRSFAQAYPEDIFLPLTAEDRKHDITITRAAAAQARHMAPYLTEAANLLESQARQIATLTAERDQLKEADKVWWESNQDLLAENLAAQESVIAISAERDRYETALQRIAINARTPAWINEVAAQALAASLQPQDTDHQPLDSEAKREV